MIKFQSAVILVADMAASRHFYEDLLGQKIVMDHGPNVGFEAGFALWQRDHALGIIFGDEPAQGSGAQGHSIELYFETEALDDALMKMVGANIQSVHEIREQPWGQRVFRVYDPDHTIVELGEPLPVVIRRFREQGATVEEIAKRMSMPVDMIVLLAER